MPQLFKPKETIWDQNNIPYLVVHVYRNATVVVGLKDKGLVTPKVILERDYLNFTKDEDK